MTCLPLLFPLRRLLLGEAVEGAEAPDEIDGVDADDVAGGEAGGEGVEGVAVVWVVEGGDEDALVGDVEVGVAGWQALALEDDRGGHGEFDDMERVAPQVAGGAEAIEVFGERQVVFVCGVGFDGGQDGVLTIDGGDEAGDVVDVAVRVVAGAASVEPEGLVDAEVVVEGLFELLAAEAGVALLDLGEEAFFGGEQNACSVGVDGAAFEDDAVVSGFGLELGQVVELRYAVRDLVVVVVVWILGPGVELPVGDGSVACRVFEEDGAGVAEPDAVGGPAMEVDAGEVGSGSVEDAVGAPLGRDVVDEDVDLFGAGEVAGDLGVDPGNGLEFAGPVFGVVGPGDPGGGVGGPFGGHTVVLAARCLVHWFLGYPLLMC